MSSILFGDTWVPNIDPKKRYSYVKQDVLSALMEQGILGRANVQRAEPLQGLGGGSNRLQVQGLGFRV